MPFGKEMMETVHHEIKLYPLKIHFTWNNLLLFLEVGDFILTKKMRNNSNRTKKTTSKDLLLVLRNMYIIKFVTQEKES